jgi:hypothetical protein
MMPQTLALSSTPELVRAYETLRAAILSSGAGATIPVHAWRLVHEGLLAWGLWAGAARETPGARGGARDIAADSPGVLSGPAPAAVVSLMATLTLQSMTPEMTPVEVT